MSDPSVAKAADAPAAAEPPSSPATRPPNGAPSGRCVLTIVALAAMSGLFLFFPIDWEQVGNWGYLGVFLVTFVATASFILPIPYLLIVARAGMLPRPADGHPGRRPGRRARRADRLRHRRQRARPDRRGQVVRQGEPLDGARTASGASPSSRSCPTPSSTRSGSRPACCATRSGSSCWPASSASRSSSCWRPSRTVILHWTCMVFPRACDAFRATALRPLRLTQTPSASQGGGSRWGLPLPVVPRCEPTSTTDRSIP